MMRLARFLTEVRKRSRTAIPPEIDPLGVLFSRVAMNRYSAEGRAPARAALAVVNAEGELLESDLWAVGQEALGMLDAFADKRLNKGYEQAMLDAMAGRLRDLLG